MQFAVCHRGHRHLSHTAWSFFHSRISSDPSYVIHPIIHPRRYTHITHPEVYLTEWDEPRIAPFRLSMSHTDCALVETLKPARMILNCVILGEARWETADSSFDHVIMKSIRKCKECFSSNDRLVTSTYPTVHCI